MTVNSVGFATLISIKGANQIRFFLEWLALNHVEVHWTGVLYRVINLDFRKSFFKS